MGQALRGEALLAPELGRNALLYLDGVNSEKQRVTKRSRCGHLVRSLLRPKS